MCVCVCVCVCVCARACIHAQQTVYYSCVIKASIYVLSSQALYCTCVEPPLHMHSTGLQKLKYLG